MPLNSAVTLKQPYAGEQLNSNICPGRLGTQPVTPHWQYSTVFAVMDTHWVFVGVRWTHTECLCVYHALSCGLQHASIWSNNQLSDKPNHQWRHSLLTRVDKVQRPPRCQGLRVFVYIYFLLAYCTAVTAHEILTYWFCVNFKDIVSNAVLYSVILIWAISYTV